MDDAIRKADVLIEALSYIRTFHDRRTVIKFGGSVLEEADALRAMLQDVMFMAAVSMRPVLVHGGGKPIDRAMAAAGLQPRKIQGRRFTDEATLEIVVRVLCHEINAEIVSQIRQLGGRAVGLHTGSMQALFGEKLLLPGDGATRIDLGRVGKVTRVEGRMIDDFCAGGVVPVIPCVALDDDGKWLNVNADTAAAAVAGSLGAEKLVFLSDTPGILADRANPASLVPCLDAMDCTRLIQQGVIDSGMIPKVEACLEALRAGVHKTHLIDGRIRHSLLLEIFTHKGVGTEITLK
ncbi:MAG TPA: acetylglutamate kinase [Gemmataceae bacterium]|nr:acetylglutamate kinase [Gemmataceae bacterium]